MNKYLTLLASSLIMLFSLNVSADQLIPIEKKITLDFSVEIKEIYDRETNQRTYPSDVFTSAQVVFYVYEYTQDDSSSTYEINFNGSMCSSIWEADYYMLPTGPEEEFYKLIDNHQDATAHFQWGTNKVINGGRNQAILGIKGTFDDGSWEHSSPDNSVDYLKTLVGKRFDFWESGIWKDSSQYGGGFGGKLFKGTATLESVDEELIYDESQLSDVAECPTSNI